MIDLGSGTGEHTVSIAKWGAKCTLVEMNSDALEIAKKVFAKKLGGGESVDSHTFLCESLFDIDMKSLRGSFDFSHSRGVFTHVADKKAAFKILSDLARPGGYVIYGDRNTAGGVQEMLQRYAIYTLAKSLPMDDFDEKIVYLAETLFEKDIDRSQSSIPRTRKAIIFDRWVIAQQDDPSASEVLSMMQSNGLEYVSSWPRIDFAGRGESTHTDPLNWSNLKNGAKTIELMWMLLNNGESENIESYLPEQKAPDFFNQTAQLCEKLRNLQPTSTLAPGEVSRDFTLWGDLGEKSFASKSNIALRLQVFAKEVNALLAHVQENKPLIEIRKLIDGFDILFQNLAGVRHVDYLAYKPLLANKQTSL